MSVNKTAMVLASFTADSHALGAHWIYDTRKIEDKFGRVESLMKPLPSSFHPNRDAGEFTHYGDQAFVLLCSLAERGGFHLDDFWLRWRELFVSYDGYMDGATKATLRNAQDGAGPENAGSYSDDLAGVSRIAPLVLRYADDRDALLEAVSAQTRMTHNNPIVVQAGLFFAQTVLSVFQGDSPSAAMEQNARFFESTPIPLWVREGINSIDKNSREAILGFGQSCHTEQAFPSVVHIIARHENDLKEALIQSVGAGGDSAGRNLIAGMVLGAYLGMEAIPDHWVSGLKKGGIIMEQMKNLLNR